MSAENQVKKVQVRRLLDVALLAYTLIGPFVNTLFKRSRQSEQLAQAVQEEITAVQSDLHDRLNELTTESRQWVTEQAQHLSEQAQHLQAQSRQLRKALRREARQRRKLLAQMSESGVDLSKDLLKRGEQLTEELVERGGKVTQNLLDFSGKTAHDLAERSGEVTHELAKRGEGLLQQVRKRDRNFWTAVGFGVGLIAAGFVTYRLVRMRMAQQETEQDERIELPRSDSWNRTQNRPVGEIRHIDQEGATVATLEFVDIERAEGPDNTVYVGVVSTKIYYPVDTNLEAEDLVHFISEEDARAQGFTPAD